MSSRLILSALVVTVAAALLGGVATARAQAPRAEAAPDASVVRARELFAQGVGFVQAERFPDAEAAFRSALALRDAPAIRYNLALVLVRRRAYPEAVANNELVLHDATTSAELRAQAEALSAQIDEFAGHARIELRGAATADVAIDGYGVSDLAVELALAPGAHVATAARDGHEVARASAEIATGQHATIVLDVPALATDDASPDPSEAAETPLLRQWWFWTAVGGGVVLVAVVLGLVIGASGDVEAPIQGNFAPGVLRW